MVVDVDNAVRTSESELQLAVEGVRRRAHKPFADAVAKCQSRAGPGILGPADPRRRFARSRRFEQRRLLTSVVVAAGKADQPSSRRTRHSMSYGDLVINAPDRLDGLTQQMVALSARLDPHPRRRWPVANSSRTPRCPRCRGTLDTTPGSG